MRAFTDLMTVLTFVMGIYMTAWFLLAVAFNRRDVVDSAWGLGFVIVAGLAFMFGENTSGYALIAWLLVSVWGFRLFLHLSRRMHNKKEDFRYQQLGNAIEPGFWLKTYIKVFLLQGALLLIISLPVIAIMLAKGEPAIRIAKIGFGVWIFGILFEALADRQLRKFIASNRRGVMQSGLWRYSRHPNYFGEITTWWGAAIVAIAYGQWWGIIGAVVITILLVKVSGIPLLEKRYANNPAYQKYAQQTSVLIPLPVKSRVRV